MAAAPCLPGLERVPTGITLETPPAGCFVRLATRDIGEATPHYKTLAEANAAHRAYYGKDGPLAIDQVLTQLLSPCVVLSCQCGAYALGEDDSEGLGGAMHFADLAEATGYATEHDMTVAGPAGREYVVLDADRSWLRRTSHRFDCASLTDTVTSGLTEQLVPTIPINPPLGGETS